MCHWWMVWNKVSKTFTEGDKEAREVAEILSTSAQYVRTRTSQWSAGTFTFCSHTKTKQHSKHNNSLHTILHTFICPPRWWDRQTFHNAENLTSWQQRGWYKHTVVIIPWHQLQPLHLLFLSAPRIDMPPSSKQPQTKPKKAWWVWEKEALYMLMIRNWVHNVKLHTICKQQNCTTTSINKCPHLSCRKSCSRLLHRKFSAQLRRNLENPAHSCTENPAHNCTNILPTTALDFEQRERERERERIRVENSSKQQWWAEEGAEPHL